MLTRCALPAVCAVVVAAGITAGAAAAHGQTRLLRYPDIHGDEVVFTHAGDLWLAPVDGGTARRLTAHPGVEYFARFSPDGRWIAFMGQYDGDEQVYVVPREGGMPRQLTFYPAPGPLPPRWGYDNQVYGWTPDGSAVLFRSMRDGWDLSDTRLYTVGRDGGLPEPLPMPVSGAGDLSPDGRRVVYAPLVRDFRHWKRYEGGWAQDLYIFDLESHEAQQITDHPRSDRDPMWIGDTVYFTSDRTGTLNLYAFDTLSGDTAQVTDSTLWDVRWPAADEAGRIVYELDGGLVVLNTASGASREIDIFVPDDGLARRPARVPVADLVEDFTLAPDGSRVLFSARGELFSAPAEHGPTRNLTGTSGAHDRAAAWSPDGERVAFVSDMDGEEEIWLVDQRGAGAPTQLTDGSTGRKEGLAWSPDADWIAYRDQKSRLFVVAAGGGSPVEIADDSAAFGLSYDWSPDSRWLAYSLEDTNGFRSLYLWNRESSVSTRLTGAMWNEYAPVFGPDGDYLYYLSDREFSPQIGSYEFNYALDRESSIYAMALRDDVPHPFPPRSDEVAADGDGDEGGSADDGGEGGEDTGDGAPQPVEIDLEGIAGRVARVPVAADNYFAVAAVQGHLLYVRGFPFYYGREPDLQAEIRLFDLAKREESTLVAGGQGYALSADGKKLLVQAAGAYTLYDVDPGGGEAGKPVATAGLAMDLVPAEEWAQIFDEVWRRFRDFFYVENMHGYDWAAIREQYRPLLEHVAHRSDLNYVLSEMIAELNTSHTYVAGGDYDIPQRPQAALLGARLELDAAAGRFRFREIMAGHNEEDEYRSPLTEVGIDVDPGDYLLAINRRQLTAGDNPYRLLRHAGGQPLELTVNDRPSPEGARQVMVDAIGDEDALLYLRWVEANRRRVEEAGGGRLGYLHIPDMGSLGLSEFIKWFYGQIRKEGLVVDVRSNGGGNVSHMIIERLRRELLMLDYERNIDRPDTYPSAVFTGHLACLLDEDTASDGDQFAYVFKESGLGPLIGKRSWGGVVGIYGRGSLIDGGSVFVPEAGSADAAGEWVIEGHGVDPDIVVENEPKEVLAGHDQQLEKAIEVLLAKLAEEPRRLPERPAPPVKTE